MVAFPPIPAHYKGPLWMVWSCFIFVIIWGLIRVVAEDIHPFVIVFYRTLFAILAFMPFLVKHGLVVIKTEHLGQHALRGMFSLFGTLGLFYAVAHVALADVVAISYSAPIFAAVGAVLILKEKVHWRRILAIVFGFVGVLVVLRPGFQEFSPGLVAAILGSFMLAGSLVVIKSLSGTDRPEAIALYSFLFVLPGSLIAALFFWSWPSFRNLLILIVIGILVSLAHTALARAFTYGKATTILPLDFSRMIFATILGAVAFNETPDYIAWTGASIILGSTVYFAYREARAQREKK